MELKEAIDNFNSIIKLYTNLDILNGIEKCKELEAIETVLQALKEKDNRIDFLEYRVVFHRQIADNQLRPLLQEQKEINESHQKENGKLQVELSKKDETISVLEFNYKNLNADIGGIAQELGLEEDATIDEMYIATRELQGKLSKVENINKLMSLKISGLDAQLEINQFRNANDVEKWFKRNYEILWEQYEQYFKEKVEEEQ